MKQSFARHPQLQEPHVPEGPGDPAGRCGSWAALPGDGLPAKTLGGPTRSSADIIEVVSVLSLWFSWLCLLRRIHGAAAKCQAVSALCKTVASLTLKIRMTLKPEGRESFAFVSLLSKIGRERVAAPLLPGLKVNFNWASKTSGAFGPALPCPSSHAMPDQRHEGLPSGNACLEAACSALAAGGCGCAGLPSLVLLLCFPSA